MNGMTIIGELKYAIIARIGTENDELFNLIFKLIIYTWADFYFI